MLKEIKYGGYSANPNDHDSVEGDLAAAMNLVPEDGTVKPVLPPSDVFTVPSGSTIMCIHKTAAYTHYILWNEDAHTLSYMDKQGDTYTATTITLGITLSGVVKVEPIGNTLVILAEDGIHYILWKPDAEGGSKYAYLGQKPPEVNITFGLDSKFEAMPGFADDGMPAEQIHIRRGNIPIKNLQMPYYDGNSGAVPPKSEAQADENFTAFDFSLEGKVGDDGTTTIDAEVSHITEHALAAVNKFIATLGTQKERFVSPFFVRYALELYDGSIYMHSCPILMIPNSRGPVFALNPNAYDWDEWESGLILRYHSGDKIEYAFNGRVIGFTSSLYYELHSESLKNWEDIIRGVGIYVSAPIYTYDQAGKVYGWEDMSDDGDWDSYYTLGRIKAEDTAMDDEPSLSGWLQDEWKRWGLIDVCRFDSKKMSQGQPTQYLFGRNSNYPNDRHEPACILRIPEFSKDNIDRRIAEECNFYKIYTIDIEDLFADHTSTPLKSGIKLEKGILDSLVTRERLTDDYQTHDLLYDDMSSVYNARINLAGIKRKLHKPIGVQFQWTKCELQGQDLGSSIAVGVRSDGKLRVVNRERTLNALMQTGQPGPLYFFYSDSNATKAYIKWGDSVYILPLRPHSTLNGAFWMGDIWCGSDWRIGLESYIGETPTEESTIITVENKIYTSEVNNPFFFPASGISTIGAGRILGLSAAVKALSQGQFGQFPLYAFTTDGVWALETNSTGGYSSAKPVSRDVCLNADSITQLDDAALFATARGIMLISGSQAQCISDAINDGDVPPENGMQTVMDAFTQLGRSYPTIAPFRDFLGNEDASLRMLYDYCHQRIIVYNPAYSYAYIYSLESHKWGMMESDIQYTINSYPDALAVTGDNVLVNYSDSPVGDGSAVAIPALLVTRPLTLDMPDILKTVRRVLQRGMFRRWQGGEHMTALLYGSRDLYDWHLIYASNGERMQGFSGTPYKWFRVALVLNVEGNESITGATIELIDKYTGKPR